MGADIARRTVTVRAHAKINLSLRILGVRSDGYHDLRTILQTVALHDLLTLTAARAASSIECDDARCPVDETNLVWRAADRLWHEAGGGGRMPGIRIRIRKRIPMQAGLGGGSSDAAATLRALVVLWRLDVADGTLAGVARDLGADVPFFLQGGTSLGLDRGDVLFPLVDRPPAWVVLVVPSIGVATRDAYAWWDASGAAASSAPAGADLENDLEAPVVARHPEIGRLRARLGRLGATEAGMSGSGSAVFGLFADRQAAASAARAVSRGPVRALLTRTLGRRLYASRSLPRVS
jgi:4-diphosphocytidyl-2-C-methyl-D-erythritol kinase